MNPCYLYKISHKELPIIYLGLTHDINTRFRDHRRESSNKLLRKYIKEFGADSFKFDILLKGDRSLIEELEALAISELKSLNRYIVCNILEGSVFTGASSQVGEAHWNAKFTEHDIINIRNIYALGGITQKEIGEIYGVGNKVISKITSGSRWKEVQGPCVKNLLSNKVANRAKLTKEQVPIIREEARKRYMDNCFSIPNMAEKYKIARQSMRLLLKGDTYKNLPGPILGIDYYVDFGRINTNGN